MANVLKNSVVSPSAAREAAPMTSAPPTKASQSESETGNTLVWHRLLVVGGLVLAALLVGVLLRYRNLMWAAAPSAEAPDAIAASSGAIVPTQPPTSGPESAQGNAPNPSTLASSPQTAPAQNAASASSQEPAQATSQAAASSGTAASSGEPATQASTASTATATAAAANPSGKPANAAPSAANPSSSSASTASAKPSSDRPAPSVATKPAATASKPAAPASATAAKAGSLADARKLADPNQASKLRHAILAAQKIQPGAPEYRAAQQAIATWNQQIWTLAERRAQQGQFQTAIAAAKLVSDSPSTLKRQAQQAIPQWEVIQSATALLRPGQASTYNRAIEKVRQIKPGQPGYGQAQQLTGQWSQQIMMLAESRASRGQVRDAIAAANLVPTDSPLYSSAQSAIARWKSRIGVL